MDADEINIIEKGRLLDSGKHEELLKKCEVYKNLYGSENLNSQ